jgi:hypothetical protein
VQQWELLLGEYLILGLQLCSEMESTSLFIMNKTHILHILYLAMLVLYCSLSFLIGIVISAILLSIVDSSVNTVLVCFAEGPMEFEENHPELSFKMRDAWRQVYPVECGF